MMRAIVPVLLLAAAALAPGAAADVDRPDVCEITIQGQKMSEHDFGDKSDAIKIRGGDEIKHSMTTTQGHPLEKWNIKLHYGPIPIKLDDDRPDEDGDQFADSGEVSPASYSWVGRGLYRLTAELHLEDGSTCNGEVLVEITGTSAASLMGWVAILLLAGGAIWLGFGAWKNMHPSKATYDVERQPPQN